MKIFFVVLGASLAVNIDLFSAVFDFQNIFFLFIVFFPVICPSVFCFLDILSYSGSFIRAKSVVAIIGACVFSESCASGTLFSFL